MTTVKGLDVCSVKQVYDKVVWYENGTVKTFVTDIKNHAK